LLSVFSARSANLPPGLYILPFVIFSFFWTEAQLSQDIGLLDRFLRYFSQKERYLRELYQSGPLFPISQRTLPWQPIFGKIGEMTFIQHAGVLKRIRISQLRFTGVRHYFCYILCNFHGDRSSNPGEGRNCTFLDEIAKIGLSQNI